MKPGHIRYKIIFLVLLCVACHHFDEDINRNPNLPTVATGPQLLASAMLSLPELSSSQQGEFLAQYLAETQYVTASLYPKTSTSFYGWYQGPLMDIQMVLDHATDKDELVVARILKAYIFWNITDRWGDVPFSEALKGDEDFTPKYDTQESIYDQLFLLLKEANASPVDGSLTNDILYGGDLTRWKKLANTIRLLMALRLSRVDPQRGMTEFNAALEDGIMESNDDNLVFRHLADANHQNYWYGQIHDQSREWWALTRGMVDKMLPVNDPRLFVYGEPNRSEGMYVGQLYGDTKDFDTEKYSLLGKSIWAQDAPVYLVTYAQALFALAEAAKLGWIAGGETEAEENYNRAIKESVLQWTGSDEGVAEMLDHPDVKYDPVSGYRKIGMQRWIHLFMHGYEAWSEWRRTGFPDDLVSPGGVAVPRRLNYVEAEKFNNAENYQQAVERQFGDEESLYGRVWWDAE